MTIRVRDDSHPQQDDLIAIRFFFTLFRIACNLKQWIVSRNFHLICLGKGTETTESEITEKGENHMPHSRGKVAEIIQQKSQLNVVEKAIIWVESGYIIVKAKCEVMRKATQA